MFNKKFNFVVGINGTGKSTLLSQCAVKDSYESNSNKIVCVPFSLLHRFDNINRGIGSRTNHNSNYVVVDLKKIWR